MEERYADFLSIATGTYSTASIEYIGRALREADTALTGLVRWDGTPLLDHSVRGAQIVISEIGLGRNSTIAMLLHDAVRLGKITLTDIEVQYGNAVAGILAGMNLISNVHTNSSLEQVDNFRDLIISYSTDPRVILIKLADRLEVMRSMAMFPEAKRRKKSWESMNLYAPIAHKLGLYTIKSELEDLALRWLEPVDYAHISKNLVATATERENFIARFTAPIEERLASLGIAHHTKGRTKSVYSVWRKMRRSGIPFEEVYDLFAIRIVIECQLEHEKQACWSVYSVVSDLYTPNPSRLRDWISIPKSNGYESLHTTVVTTDGHWVEIQIRTKRMDEVAERGIAAHWRYKGIGGSGIGQDEWLARLRELMEDTDKKQLSEKLDTAHTTSEIFVFTPKGDLRKLPEGAVVLDFAYDIHSNIGDKCTGAKIGERVVPIKEPLRNGDIVNIITARNQHPKPDWLSIVRTNKARNRIKLYLREESEKQARLGREELERKLKNWKLAVQIDDAVSALCKHLKFKTGMELYGQIAAGKLSLSAIRDVLERYITGELFAPQIRTTNTPQAKNADPDDGDALIIDEAIKGLDYKLAKCCNPIYGDDIFGFTTISSGITIHRTDCPNAERLHVLYPYRVLDARWRSSIHAGSFVATIRIVAEDTTGIVNRITDYITRDLKINIRSLSLSPTRDGKLGGSLNIEVPSTAVLDMVAFNLLKIKGVEKAYRINK